MDPWDMQEDGSVGYAGTRIHRIGRNRDPQDMQEQGSSG